MRGHVLTADTGTEPGTIMGDDGKTYIFHQTNVRGGDVLAPGAGVDFIGMGDEARDVYGRAVAAEAPSAPTFKQPDLVGAATGATGAAATGAAAGAAATGFAAPAPLNYDTSGGEKLNVWQYFWRAITSKYIDGKGRARRMEYWSFILFQTIGLIVAIIIDSIITGIVMVATGNDEIIIPLFTVLFYLGMAIPGICLWVRRFHDLDMSGWMYLLSLIPYLGGLILLVFAFIPGKPGTNKYGPSPKYGPGESIYQNFT